MTNETLHSELLGIKNLVETQFDGINQRLDKINGRVGKNEDKVNDILIERARYTEEQKNTVNLHYINCPNNKKLDEINTKFEDVSFFVRHPKLFIGGMVVIIILTLMTFFDSNKMIQGLINPNKIEVVK
jgi:hypothetical protein